MTKKIAKKKKHRRNKKMDGTTKYVRMRKCLNCLQISYTDLNPHRCPHCGFLFSGVGNIDDLEKAQQREEEAKIRAKQNKDRVEVE